MVQSRGELNCHRDFILFWFWAVAGAGARAVPLEAPTWLDHTHHILLWAGEDDCDEDDDDGVDDGWRWMNKHKINDRPQSIDLACHPVSHPASQPQALIIIRQILEQSMAQA